MRIRSDGSVQSANVPTYQNMPKREDNGFHRCMVTRVIYSDDPSNITKNADNKEVLYDVVVIGGFDAGQPISNCRLSSDLGGNLNYYERVLKAASKKVSGNRLEQQDGDIVFVQFVQGHEAYPVIVALDKGISTKKVIGATKSEGHISRRQYNGIFESIDKEGVYKWVRRGGRFDSAKDEFFPNDAEQYSLVRGKNEKITETFFSGLVNFTDGKNDFHRRVYNGGLTILEQGKDDKYEVTTSGGAAFKMADGTIALGADGIELLAKISEALEKIATWAQSVGATHDHIGNMGYPTAPPTQASDYIQLATDLNALKAEIDGITGSL